MFQDTDLLHILFSPWSQKLSGKFKKHIWHLWGQQINCGRATSASSLGMVLYERLFHGHYCKRRKPSALELQVLYKHGQTQGWSSQYFGHSSNWSHCLSMMFPQFLCKLHRSPWLLESTHHNWRKKKHKKLLVKVVCI